jgi:hypothetical protein
MDELQVTEAIKLTPAETNVVTTQKLMRHMDDCLVHIGGLLKENRDNSYHSYAGMGTWKDYVEQLGISESKASRLISIHDIVMSHIMSIEDVKLIGEVRMALLIPLAPTKEKPLNEITPDLIELAKVCTNRDLRIHLGYKVPQNDPEYTINCPNCGETIYGVKRVKKDV